MSRMFPMGAAVVLLAIALGVFQWSPSVAPSSRASDPAP